MQLVGKTMLNNIKFLYKFVQSLTSLNVPNHLHTPSSCIQKHLNKWQFKSFRLNSSMNQNKFSLEGISL